MKVVKLLFEKILFYLANRYPNYSDFIDQLGKSWSMKLPFNLNVYFKNFWHSVLNYIFLYNAALNLKKLNSFDMNSTYIIKKLLKFDFCNNYDQEQIYKKIAKSFGFKYEAAKDSNGKVIYDKNNSIVEYCEELLEYRGLAKKEKLQPQIIFDLKAFVNALNETDKLKILDKLTKFINEYEK